MLFTQQSVQRAASRPVPALQMHSARPAPPGISPMCSVPPSAWNVSRAVTGQNSEPYLKTALASAQQAASAKKGAHASRANALPPALRASSVRPANRRALSAKRVGTVREKATQVQTARDAAPLASTPAAVLQPARSAPTALAVTLITRNALTAPKDTIPKTMVCAKGAPLKVQMERSCTSPRSHNHPA
jgi:hypothetical protein